MNLCIVIFSLAIMGYTTAFTPPFQATLPKARSAKSRVTMSMSSPGGNNGGGDGGTTNQKSRVTMSSPGGDNDDGDGGGKTAIEKSDATISYKVVFRHSLFAVICVMQALTFNDGPITEPIELPIGTIQPAVPNAALTFLRLYVIWSVTGR